MPETPTSPDPVPAFNPYASYPTDQDYLARDLSKWSLLRWLKGLF